MVHRLGQLDVPEVTRAVLQPCCIGGALGQLVHRAQLGIAEAVELSFPSHQRLLAGDVSHRVVPLRRWQLISFCAKLLWVRNSSRPTAGRCQSVKNRTARHLTSQSRGTGDTQITPIQALGAVGCTRYCGSRTPN